MAQSITSFGRRVRYLRSKAEDLSQRELDALAGLHQGHVWQIEGGHRENPKLATVSGLQRVFGVSADWLLHGIGDCPSDSHIAAAIKAARFQKSTQRAALQNEAPRHASHKPRRSRRAAA